MQAIGYNCGELESLNLGWCEEVSDAGVMSLAFGCHDLRALDLCGCVLITGTFDTLCFFLEYYRHHLALIDMMIICDY